MHMVLIVYQVDRYYYKYSTIILFYREAIFTYSHTASK